MSSINKRKQTLGVDLYILFIYLRKRRGPKTLVWGTPIVNALLSDLGLIILTPLCLPERWELKQLSGKPRMP